MANQPPFAEYPRPGYSEIPGYGRGPGVYFDAIGEAWNLVMKDLGHWIAATIVYFVVYYAIYLPVAVFSAFVLPISNDPVRAIPLGILRIALSIIPASVSYVLIVGMVSMGVRKVRGEYINVGMMFEPFLKFGTVAGTSFLYFFVILLAFLALVLPFFYIAPVLLLMPTVAYLKRVGPFEAMSLTYKHCKEFWAGLLGLSVVLSLIGVAGGLACCVGTFITFPLIAMVIAIHYRAFFESQPTPSGAYPGA